MKNKRGAVELVLIVVVLAAVAAGAYFLFMRNKTSYPAVSPTPEAMMEEGAPSPSPVSDSTDIETMEEELEETVVGDFEADIDLMVEEASSL